MDNLEYTLDLPMEEVFAQATISTQAISHMLVFPDGGNGVKYIETAFIDEQDEKRQQEWRKAYDYILKKVTYLYGGRQLLLKSPCLLYTSDAADEEDSVALGGRRITTKKKKKQYH